MEAKTIKKIRFFWPWQDEEEEAWLESLSREGLHLASFGLPRTYLFRKGEPKNFVYRLDFLTSKRQDKGEYLQLFHDAGWEYLGERATWQYFRKEARPGEEPEIFSDPESKIQKYRRLSSVMGVMLVALLLLGTGTLLQNRSGDGLHPFFQFIIFLTLTLYVAVMIGIFRRIGRLQKLR